MGVECRRKLAYQFAHIGGSAGDFDLGMDHGCNASGLGFSDVQTALCRTSGIVVCQQGLRNHDRSVAEKEETRQSAEDLA